MLAAGEIDERWRADEGNRGHEDGGEERAHAAARQEDHGPGVVVRAKANDGAVRCPTTQGRGGEQDPNAAQTAPEEIEARLLREQAAVDGGRPLITRRRSERVVRAVPEIERARVSIWRTRSAFSSGEIRRGTVAWETEAVGMGSLLPRGRRWRMRTSQRAARRVASLRGASCELLR